MTFHELSPASFRTDRVTNRLVCARERERGISQHAHGPTTLRIKPVLEVGWLPRFHAIEEAPLAERDHVLVSSHPFGLEKRRQVGRSDIMVESHDDAHFDDVRDADLLAQLVDHLLRGVRCARGIGMRPKQRPQTFARHTSPAGVREQPGQQGAPWSQWLVVDNAGYGESSRPEECQVDSSGSRSRGRIVRRGDGRPVQSCWRLFRSAPSRRMLDQ